jgi:isopenicillin-N N-acyltransferase-like protein
VLTLSVLTAILYTGYLTYTDLAPEDVRAAEATPEVDRSGRRVTYGRSSLARERQLWLLHLEGSPEEIGDAHGNLGSRLFANLDRHVSERLGQRYGAWLESWGATMVMRWDFRDADDALPDAARRELAASPRPCPRPPTAASAATTASSSTRTSSSSAAASTTSSSRAACSPRRASPQGRHLERGNLIVGRNFFVDLGPEVEPDRLVTFYYPDGKYPYVSVAWAGLLGVVTGVNARGIVVALNPTAPTTRSRPAPRSPLVLRQVLEEADTLEQALEILRAADLRTSGAVLVGDGRQRKSAIVELAPRDKKKSASREATTARSIWATNHLVREPFDRDAQNDRIRRYTSSWLPLRAPPRAALRARSPPASIAAARAVDDPPRPSRPRRRGARPRQPQRPRQPPPHPLRRHRRHRDGACGSPRARARSAAFGPSTSATLSPARAPARPRSTTSPPTACSTARSTATTRRPSRPRARPRLLAAGLPHKALVDAKLALALAPDVGDLHRLLGDIERELGNLADGARPLRALPRARARQACATRSASAACSRSSPARPHLRPLPRPPGTRCTPSPAPRRALG